MSTLNFLIKKAAAANAHRFDIAESLILAIVRVESDGQFQAYRAEPRYRYLFDVEKLKPFRALTDEEQVQEHAPKDFPFYESVSSRTTEFRGQQASWGPMQVMGATARELGFTGQFPLLCNDTDGMFFGCFFLSDLRNRFLKDFGWAGVVAAYNAGSPRFNEYGEFVNQAYVDEVAKAGFSEEDRVERRHV